MRRALPYVAAMLIYSMTPAAGELAENALLLVTQGRLADADSHRDAGPEHHCSGPFHACSCHASAPFTAPEVIAVLGAPDRRGAQVTWSTDDRASEGYRAAVFRPPIA